MARKLPHTVIGLIEELEVDYPPTCIQPEETLAEANRRAGAVELVSLLRARYQAGLRKEQKGLPPVIQ